MVYSQVILKDSSSQNVGSLITSNGIGDDLLIGPPFLPIIPVGFFEKKRKQFIMDLEVITEPGYFMALAIDSDSYKKIPTH